MDYLHYAAKELLLKHGFNPAKDSAGNIISDKYSILLFHSEWGRNRLVELINADQKDDFNLADRFEKGSDFIQNHPEIHEIYYVYFFTGIPEQNMLDSIKNLQMTDYRTGKFIRSLAVVAEYKQVHTFARDPYGQSRILKILQSAFKSDSFSHIENNCINVSEYIETILNSEDYKAVCSQANLHFSRSRPAISWAILAINVLLFIIMESSGGSENGRILVNFGAKYNPAIRSGEYWRLFTPMFLHIGFVHLFMNSYSLYALRFVENIYGSARFLIIFLLAGITGNLASFLLSPHLSAGASGAIFGLMGSLLYIWMVKPRAYARVFGTGVITVIIANVIFGFSFAGIDNYAHLGGLIGGFIAALIVRLPRSNV